MKRIFVSLFILISFSISAFSQRQGLKNIPYIDQRRMHYGFLLGITCGDIAFQHSGSNAWGAECPQVNPSFCVGLVGDLAFTEQITLRCTPMLKFMSRDIKFANTETQESRKQTLKSNYISLPISLKIASHRINNYRPYVLAGASIDYDLTHEKEQPIVFKRTDIGLHIALGCDTYLPYFKFCPELRFNIGLLDMTDHKRKGIKDLSLMPYTEAVSKALNKSLSLILYFE
ncbi:MAG: porin family protein [Bacteroidales bacterium]|nr:porin family protein [Bacteroidales bacterium]